MTLPGIWSSGKCAMHDVWIKLIMGSSPVVGKSYSKSQGFGGEEGRASGALSTYFGTMWIDP